MAVTVHDFHDRVQDALKRPQLKVALERTTGLLTARRAQAYADYQEFEPARDLSAAIKDHVLDHLDYYLDEFARNAEAAGVKVHWARTKEEACQAVLGICREHEAKSVTRVKSMLGEEIGLPHALEEAGIERVETDLAEHIIQLAGDPPSHIVMPAMHKTHEEVGALFKQHHKSRYDGDDIGQMVESARAELREKYVAADIGISGANFLVADNGSVVTVTNEGNAELTTALPRVHIVTAGIDKLVPSVEHATVLLRVLARSATGAEITQYTTFYNGPKRAGDLDGPEAMHIVLVDNRRTEMLGGAMKTMLRCIRCGACMNHCPVYSNVGGHAYGSTYPGPMGSVLTPAMTSLEEAKDLPNACTLNGRCAEVCPVKIPLPDLMRHLREEQWRRQLISAPYRYGLRLWAFAARHPALYRLGTRMALPVLRLMGGKRGTIRRLPLFASAWTEHRDLPAPAKTSFMAQYQAQQRRKRAA